MACVQLTIPSLQKKGKKDTDETMNWTGLPMRSLVCFSERLTLECDGGVVNQSCGRAPRTRVKHYNGESPSKDGERKLARGLLPLPKEGLYSFFHSLVDIVVDCTQGRTPRASLLAPWEVWLSLSWAPFSDLCPCYFP